MTKATTANAAAATPPNPPSSSRLYLRLLRHVRPYWKAFALGLLGMAIMAATEPLFPALMKPLLDRGFAAKSHDALWIAPVTIIAIFALRGVLAFSTAYLMAWVSNRVVMDLRLAMFGRLLTLPTQHYDERSTGALMSKVLYDVSSIAQAATAGLTVSVRDSLTVLALITWLLWLNWRLTLVALVVSPLIALVTRRFAGRMRSASRASQATMGEMTHILEESISAHRVVKIFGGQDYEARRFLAANQRLRQQNMRSTSAAASTVPIVQGVTAIALAIVIYVALLQSAQAQTTVGGFVSFVTAMLMLLAPIKRITEVSGPLQQGLASCESVFGLIDLPPERDCGNTHIERARGEIAFENVSFRYPQGNRAALADVRLTIPAGQTVALVGASGSGKTTLANLIPRLHHVAEGRILIDGVALEDIKLKSLRANIALVSQDVVLFNDTVAANIAYGAMAAASREAVEQAARAAYADEFIRAMPNGYDTMVGENGVRLSGGQRQRLAIARALLKNAPILILDEATSALDSQSEHQVQAALEELMKHRTTLVIAHRLSTIEHADRIVVLEAGRIAEEGCHADLIARNGKYARLYSRNFDLEDTAEPADSRDAQ